MKKFKKSRKIICDLKESRIVFHFNKKHNEDSSIPRWVLKHKGKTYYVDSVESDIPFRTKDMESEHTKGGLQFKGALTIIENSKTNRIEALISRAN